MQNKAKEALRIKFWLSPSSFERKMNKFEASEQIEIRR